MTEKEKAKAYDEALKKASAAHKDEDRHLKATLERIFPELKESEDEKIRKEIISILRNAYWTSNRNRFNKLVAWLEKQGKKSTDKIEPSFKVGDWVVFITSGSAYQVEKKENYEYTLKNIHGGLLCVSFSNEKLIREWTIQDANDGDVLEFEDHGRFVIGILSFVNKTTGKVDVSCLLECNKFKVGVFYNLDTVKPHPATKEQRDTFMKAIKDAGYEWDAEKKELKKKIK